MKENESAARVTTSKGALNWNHGSVRAVLAISLVAAVIAATLLLVVLGGDGELVKILVMAIINMASGALGYYFGSAKNGHPK